MATRTSFSVPCPSCEAKVPIRDPKLIGRKIDCPKCKYRFVVEEPAEQADADEEAGGNGKQNGTAEGITTNGKKNGTPAVTGKKPANGKPAPAKKPMPRPDDDARDEIDDPRPKKKRGAPSPMVMVGIGLGGIAVIGLIVAAVFGIAALMGDDPPAKTPTPGANVGDRKPDE